MTTFANAWLENDGMGHYSRHLLPKEAQVSSVYDIFVADFDGDNYLDLLIGGNLLGSEVETPRNDASIGLVLMGQKDHTFRPLSPFESGIQMLGEIRSILPIKKEGQDMILISKNQGRIQEIAFKPEPLP